METGESSKVYVEIKFADKLGQANLGLVLVSSSGLGPLTGVCKQTRNRWLPARGRSFAHCTELVPTGKSKHSSCQQN